MKNRVVIVSVLSFVAGAMALGFGQFLLAGTPVQAQESRVERPVGRYMLVATAPAVSENGNTTMSAQVWKIDTMTGETSQVR